MPVFEIGGDNGFQIIDVVEKRMIEFTHIRRDIAWHGDVDEEHISVFTFPHDIRERLSLDEIIRGVGRANDNIGINEEIEIAIIGEGCSIKLFCDFDCPFIRTICNNHVRDTICNEVLCCELTHLSCANNRNSLSFECIENLFGEFNSGVTDGDSTSSDCRLGSDAFTNAEGFGE